MDDHKKSAEGPQHELFSHLVLALAILSLPAAARGVAVKTARVGQVGLGAGVMVVISSYSVRKVSGGVIRCVLTDLFVGIWISFY
jgi:hypothetical protein